MSPAGTSFDLARYQDPLTIQRVLHHAKTVAIVGLSKNELRASHFVGYYLRRHGFDVIAVNPKAVSILIGTNDLDQGGEPEVIVENLKTIVADLLKTNGKLPIIVNKVMPRGAKPGKYPEKIHALNALYEQAFAGNPQITFCDTWSLFDAGNGQCKKEEFPDMLHPNSVGYGKWTEALRPIFAKLGL